MTARNFLARLAGAGMIAAGIGAALWLRALMPDAPQAPTLLEFVLVLASLVLTLGGAVLTFHGDRLLDRQRPAQRLVRRSDACFFDDSRIVTRLLARRSGRGI